MITSANPYYAQVRLLVQVLPFVARETCFALKGGTAINLFVRDMPRLSVDIDLAFVPISDYETALTAIDAALRRIKADLERMSPPYRVLLGAQDKRRIRGLLVSDRTAQIKIEVSPVLRGCVYPESERRIVAPAEAEFGFAEVSMLSLADVYAGKLVAALDRQHPRDLFDVKLLLEAEGISDELFRAFLVYLISHDGSLARVIDPEPKPIADLYAKQFKEMTVEEVSLEQLEETRAVFISELHSKLRDEDKRFLLSFKGGDPDWGLLGVSHAKDLPAVRWKLMQLDRMKASKRTEALAKLERVLARI